MTFCIVSGCPYIHRLFVTLRRNLVDTLQPGKLRMFIPLPMFLPTAYSMDLESANRTEVINILHVMNTSRDNTSTLTRNVVMDCSALTSDTLPPSKGT